MRGSLGERLWVWLSGVLAAATVTACSAVLGDFTSFEGDAGGPSARGDGAIEAVPVAMTGSEVIPDAMTGSERVPDAMTQF